MRVIMPAIIDQAGRKFNVDEADGVSRRHSHRAMTAGTRLLLIEEVIPAGDAYHPSKFDDLNMLVTLHGARADGGRVFGRCSTCRGSS